MQPTDHRNLQRYPWILAISCLAMSPLAAQELSNAKAQHTLSLGGYFSTGNYGNSDDTRVRYFPMSYRFGRGDWSLQISAPYLEIDGSNDLLINGAGISSRTDGSKKGLGDTMVTFKYELPNMSSDGPYLDLVLQTKLPTADEDRELGTGKADYSARLDILQPAGRATLFGFQAPETDCTASSVSAFRYRRRCRVAWSRDTDRQPGSRTTRSVRSRHF